MIDLLIKDGLIIDGTGSPGFHAAIGIEGDTISILRGDVSDIESKQVINATGKIVCPGFIDVHAHSKNGISAVSTNYYHEYSVHFFYH